MMAEERYYRVDRRKNWKSVQFDYNAILAMDYGDSCVRLDFRTRAILLAALEQVKWPTRWYGESIDPDLIQKWVENASYQLMKEGDCEGGNMLLRQNPNSPCLLEYSNDNGETWQIAFNHALCFVPTQKGASQISVEIDINNTYIEETNTTYAGDITNVTNNWLYQGDATDIDRDTAMCWALGQLIDLFCGEAIYSIERGNNALKSVTDWWTEFDIFAGIAFGSLTAVGLFPPATGVAAVAFLGGAIMNEIFEALLLDDATPYADMEARKTVKCAMLARLTGQTPQYTRFASSLSDTQSGNAEIIRQAMLKVVGNEDFYVQFMIMFDTAYNLVLDDSIGCDCGNADWVIIYDTYNYNGIGVASLTDFPPGDPDNLNVGYMTYAYREIGTHDLDSQIHGGGWDGSADHRAIGITRHISDIGVTITKFSAGGNLGRADDWDGVLKLKVKQNGVWSATVSMLYQWVGTTWEAKEGDLYAEGVTDVAVLGQAKYGIYMTYIKVWRVI